MDEHPRRPIVATIAAAGLFAVAGLTMVAGFLISWASNCCGSPDPQDPFPAVIGTGVALATALAGWMLLTGNRPARDVLAGAAVLPVACGIASTGSSDLAALAPVIVVGWCVLFAILRRRRVADWLTQDDPRDGQTLTRSRGA
jgi:hypothetical protein